MLPSGDKWNKGMITSLVVQILIISGVLRQGKLLEFGQNTIELSPSFMCIPLDYPSMSLATRNIK